MTPSDDDAGAWQTRRFTIQNSKGLHARASAKFVRCAEQFNAEMQVSRDGQTVPATSIMGLLMLAATCGSSIDVAARGLEAGDALAALDSLIASKFGEDEAF
jgi:phosphocarrier protein